MKETHTTTSWYYTLHLVHCLMIDDVPGHKLELELVLIQEEKLDKSYLDSLESTLGKELGNSFGVLFGLALELLFYDILGQELGLELGLGLYNILGDTLGDSLRSSCGVELGFTDGKLLGKKLRPELVLYLDKHLLFDFTWSSRRGYDTS